METYKMKLPSKLEKLRDSKLLTSSEKLGWDTCASITLPIINELMRAMEFYEDSEKWGTFISTGGIFEEQDGDFLMAFDAEDSPWSKAREALAKARAELGDGE